MPIVESIDPPTHMVGESVDVTITGQNFFTAVERQLNEADKFRQNSRFLAYLHPTTRPNRKPIPLTNVKYINAEAITGAVPAETQVGTYNVQVITPLGDASGMNVMFTVVESPSDTMLDDNGTDSDGDTDTCRGEACLAPTDTDSDTDTNSDSEVDSATGRDEETDSVADTTSADSERDTVTDIGTDTGVDTAGDTITQTETTSEPETDIETETDEITDSETETAETETADTETADTETADTETADTEPNTDTFVISDGEEVAFRPSSSIVIDGILDEAAWVPITRIEQVVSGTLDDMVVFDLLWDTQYLYIGVAVYDDVLRNDNGEIWDNDMVDVVIDGGHERSAGLDANDDHCLAGYDDYNLYCESEDYAPHQGDILHAWQEMPEGGYAVEIAMPWSHLGVDPSNGMLIGFDIGVRDNDGGGNRRDNQLRWHDNSDLWWDPVRYGEVILIDQVL